MLQGTVLSYDWYKTGEGQGLMAHFIDPKTGHRKLYGFLEQPSVPPSIECQEFKLLVVGQAGVGKTAVTAWLAGLMGWNRQAGESPGVRVTSLYWPAKVHNALLVFKLHIWEAGDSAVRKYGHVYPACKEGAQGVLFLFSYTDRASWEDLPGLIQRTRLPQDILTPIVIGNKYGSLQENAVATSEVAEFEQAWNIPVVRVRQQTNSINPASLPEVAEVLNTICEQLWLANRRPKHAIHL